MSALNGGVFEGGRTDENAELRALVDDIGQRSVDARSGHRGLPQDFDDALWRNLVETGLDRLNRADELGAGPTELAIVLRGLARHAGAVPLAETDLLAAWLGDKAGIELPDGPLTVALCAASAQDGRVVGTAQDVPWLGAAAAVLLAARTSNNLHVVLLDPADLDTSDGHNLAGEPRSSFEFALPAELFVVMDTATAEQLTRRGAWARCVQIIGALDAAAELTVSHTRQRMQFGRPLSKFQAVQHSLAEMAGEIERARAATTLAVAAAADHGFDTPETDYALTVAKVVVGQAVHTVVTLAHQLHGAIGVTIEHPLWLATMRARSWVDEFGSTGWYARRLGQLVLAATDPWDALIGNGFGGC
ncbi:acyl-CoA dehydrogenase family protein [Mycobacterium sp.]|uniref:acyl-CoA dehydrogenase family protein n=1 Tax=Mycobacterium sp. TaxID=1785 RepID=UPI003D0A8A66